ncbi:MAG: class I SAM-dependent methyltransferase [Candidatus Levybacteria bacterium]|nr:class I SAM-dependent methyltransferase [Candidatus Levybacteria bacterium]
MQKVKKIYYCRLCKSKKLKKVLDLGKTPPANSFLKKTQLKDKEDFFPLVVNFCTNCGQLQLSHVVSPEILFRHYVWVSSTSPVTVRHFEEYASSVFKKVNLKKGDLVVEMGSNDGVLLKPFKRLGAKVLGVDPARNVARRATKEGILTLPHFFNVKIAEGIVKKYGKAKVIAANNVFAHINDLDEIVKAVCNLLDKEGVFVIEAPYNIDLVEKNLFDIVYHEHVSYLAIKPLDKFFKSFGMQVFDVVKREVHGGSVRIFVKMDGAKHEVSKSVKEFIDLENEKKLFDINTYYEFAKQVERNKISLLKLLKKLKKENKSIAGYGAPAKSTTLLHYFGIGKEIIDFIADDSHFKHGLYSPGKHIPVVPPQNLYTKKPDYLLILAWNFANPIMKMHAKFRAQGGKFIVPVPEPKIYD